MSNMVGVGWQLFDANPVALCLGRLEDGRVVRINDAYARLFGVTPSQIVGHDPLECGIRELTADGRAVRAGTIDNLQIELASPAGPKIVLLSSSTVLLEAVPHALSTFVDITDRVRAEATARATDQHLRELAESVNEVFWLTDPANTKMLYVSPAYERVFGRTRAALYTDARDWMANVHHEDRDAMARFGATELDGPREATYRIVRGKGDVRWIHVMVFPVRDESGAVIRIAGVGEDVTNHVQLEEQVRQTQKLESLGLLAGGVAHDFNNILAVVAANSGLLAEVIPPTHPDRELVDEIEAAVVRATSLTRQLLAFSRKQVVEPVVLDLNKAVNETRKMLRRMVGEDIVIATSLEPDLGHVRIDPGYLVQVLMNLAVNSRDAMPRGGTLTLTTRTVGPNIMLAVSDNGSGMSPEIKSRVFEPFFTTKGIGKGTGLGLSVVHGIVDQAGGRLELESELGLGTTIKIFLPHVDQPADQVGRDIAVDVQGAEKIVLVDDDLFVRTSTSRALRSRGYQVLEAGDGNAALQLLRDHGNVGLLLTDVVMPGMDGRELAIAARSRRPSLKVLYMSGYTDDAVLQHGALHGEATVLEKPFRGHTLAVKVRQILDGLVRAA